MSGRYFSQTRSLTYSYFFSLPLFLLYESLIRISNIGTVQPVRISVDIWFQQLFAFAGLDALTAALGIAFLVGAVILFRQRDRLPSLKPRYFLYLLLESAVYAIVFSTLITNFLDLILQMDISQNSASLSKIQLFALSLGAGLYEELFFRVILVSVLFILLIRFFDNKNVAYVYSAIIAAVIFSGVHYVGAFADAWSLNSFLYRFIFGLTLNLIYVIRGFGCAAWTHALYDVLVVFKM
ncbi:MAG: CPBP family glutamic-type intramembrane protease [Balneolaceae bacterium]